MGISITQVPSEEGPRRLAVARLASGGAPHLSSRLARGPWRGSCRPPGRLAGCSARPVRRREVPSVWPGWPNIRFGVTCDVSPIEQGPDPHERPDRAGA